MNRTMESKPRAARLIAGAALALCLTAGAWAQPGEGGPGGRGDHGGPEWGGGEHGMDMIFSPHMFHELNLTPDQEKKLKDMHLANEKKKIQLFGERMSLELDLKNVLSTYPVNKSEALKIGEKISDVEHKMLTLKIESMSDILGSLTADQHRKLMDLQAEMMEKRKAWREEFKDWKGPKGKHDGEGRGDRDSDKD